MTTSKIRSLESINFLASLPDKDRQALEQRCAWRDCKKDEQIIDRDSDSRDVYFVVAGNVRVVNYSYSGREVSYDDVGPGSIIGELAAIDGKPRSANVVALNNATVASMSPDAFKQIVTGHPTIAAAVMERLVQIIRESNDRIMDLSTMGAFNRVYAELLRLARGNLDEEDYSAVIDPIPIHSDLASRAGTTRETVARAIGELTRKGVVEKQGQTLNVPDMEQLEDIVEGDVGA